MKWIFILLLLAGVGLILTTWGDAQAKKTPTPTPSPTATSDFSFYQAHNQATPTPIPTLSPTSASACPLPDLWAGIHISASGSYTETESAAAGPMVCRIQPGSCAYHLLVGNLNSMLKFKREEEAAYSDEDLLMHPAMLLPLNRLDQLIQAEWGGIVQLRITDAYDSQLEHDLGQADANRRISQHFEGRSIDLTTWPIDATRYPRLCILAHCAGFAWVHNEGDHCHATIKAESLCRQCQD